MVNINKPFAQIKIGENMLIYNIFVPFLIIFLQDRRPKCAELGVSGAVFRLFARSAEGHAEVPWTVDARQHICPISGKFKKKEEKAP